MSDYTSIQVICTLGALGSLTYGMISTIQYVNKWKRMKKEDELQREEDRLQLSTAEKIRANELERALNSIPEQQQKSAINIINIVLGEDEHVRSYVPESVTGVLQKYSVL